MSRTRQRQWRQLASRILEASAAGVFLGAVSHHVWNQDFQPLAAFCLPVLVAMFGFTSLLYMRGRSLARSRDQVRTLFAAERAMQAAMFQVTGVAFAMAIYGLLKVMGLQHDPDAPGWSSLLLLLYLAPHALMQLAFIHFMGAAWVIAPQFVRRVTPFEVWRRVRHVPA